MTTTPARERWLFDGWEVTDGTVRDWEYRSGTEGVAAMSGSNATVPNRSGEIWRPKTLGPGAFTLNVWLAATNRLDAEAAYQTLVRAVVRPHRLVQVTRYMASGLVIQCDAELSGGMQPVQLGQVGYRCALDFHVPRGSWYSQSTYSVSSTVGSALTQTLALTPFAASTAAMEDLAYEIKGTITSPILVDRTDGVDGDSVKYTGTVGTGQSLKYDSAVWGITGTNGLNPSIAAVAPTGPRLLTVVAARPGATPTVQLRGTGGNGTTQLIVSGRMAFAC